MQQPSSSLGAPVPSQMQAQAQMQAQMRGQQHPTHMGAGSGMPMGAVPMGAMPMGGMAQPQQRGYPAQAYQQAPPQYHQAPQQYQQAPPHGHMGMPMQMGGMPVDNGMGGDQSSGVPREEMRAALESFWEEQRKEMEELAAGGGKGETAFKNHNDLPLARIKRIMKSDEDVRMIRAETPVLFARACELFILELTIRAWCFAEKAKRRNLHKEDVQAAVAHTEIFDFLVEVINTPGAMPAGMAGAPTGAVAGMPMASAGNNPGGNATGVPMGMPSGAHMMSSAPMGTAMHGHMHPSMGNSHGAGVPMGSSAMQASAGYSGAPVMMARPGGGAGVPQQPPMMQNGMPSAGGAHGAQPRR